MNIITNKYFAIVGVLVFFFSIGALIANVTTDGGVLASPAQAEWGSTCGSCDDDSTSGHDDDDDDYVANPPVCDISADLEHAAHGDSFTVSWNGSPSTATYKINGHEVVADDAATYTFDGQYDYMRFTLYGENGDGDCGDEAIVYKKEDHIKPTCDITASVETAADGESYTISWEGTPESGDFKINGEAVADSGSRTMTFAGPGFESYVFTGSNGLGGICSDKVVVTETESHPPMVCSDYGFDFTIAKWNVEGNTFSLDQAVVSPYTVSVSGNDQAIDWTASPAVAGVLTKAATNYTVTNGGTSGTVTKGDIGTGQHDISNISFCGYEAVKECKLAVHKSVDKHTAVPGDTLTYTINVENVGTADCTGGGVKIVDHVDSNLTFLSATETGDINQGYGGKSLYEGGVLRWNAHTLVPGEEVTIIWKGEVKQPTQCGEFKVYNTAKATAKELNNFGTWVESQQVQTDINSECPQAPQCVSFTASPTSLPYGGGEVTLSWELDGVYDSATIDNGVGAITTDEGSVTDSVSDDTTYTLIMTADGFSDVTCHADVKVNDDKPTPPECPLAPHTDKTIVNFDEKRIRSDQNVSNSRTNKEAVNLPAGEYKVVLVGWDGYNRRVNVTQPNERYAVEFFNNATKITTSASLDDLQDRVRETTRVQVVNSALDVQSVITDVRAAHSVYPDKTSANSLVPICASFEKLPEEEKDPITCENNAFFNAEPDALGVGGGETTLTWDTTNADTVLLDGVAVAIDDQQTVAVTDDTTFTLTVTGDDTTTGNTVSCPISVTVEDPQPEPITCEDNVAFSATPTNLPFGGGEVTLTWSTTKIDSVEIDGIARDLSGTTNLNVTEDTTLTLVATGDDDTTENEVSCPVTITVADPEPEPITCEGNVTFTADPMQLGVGGGTTTLSWSTADVDSVSINGTTEANSGNKAVFVGDDTTFTLVAVGDSDTTGNEVSCPVTVTVDEDTPDPLTCSDVTFTASDTSVRTGSDVTLSWSWGSDVTGASIDTGIGAVSNNDSRTVTINDDITYRITIENADSEVTCPLPIDATSGGGGGGGSSSPRCDLEISDTRISLGDEITLTWNTSRATEVTITDDEGNIVMTTDEYLAPDKEEFYDGEITLQPTRDTEYTLLAERGSRDRECAVEVEVDGVTVIETRTQEPRVAGIALTQVPYTGFEAGPMLTALFYGLLTLWALFVAYVLVIRRDSLGGVSLPGAHEHAAYTDQSVETASARMNAAESYVATATKTSAPTNLPTETPTAPVVGYDALAVAPTEVDDELAALENYVHEQHTLISSDAMRYFIGHYGTDEAAHELMNTVIVRGKATFPSEDGWLVLNLARLQELVETSDAATTTSTPENLPTAPAAEVVESVTTNGIGSLAEAIVTGNIVAAYQLIAHRPMIALADAASDLDAVYRLRKGESAVVSDLLMNETAAYSDDKLAAAIAALTGALDGTYASEEEAVKMAIMKAVKALA